MSCLYKKKKKIGDCSAVQVKALSLSLSFSDCPKGDSWGSRENYFCLTRNIEQVWEQPTDTNGFLFAGGEEFPTPSKPPLHHPTQEQSLCVQL